MNTIDTSELTPEEKNELFAKLSSEQKNEKQRKKDDRAAFKELSEEFVHEHIESLIGHKKSTDKVISDIIKNYKHILELKEKVYGVKQQYSHTSTLSDGSASIKVGYNVTIGFNGTESAGVEKIKEYMASLSSDKENVIKLSKMVNTFLAPNSKTGMLNPAKIIELNKLREEFNDERFNDGLDIIYAAQIHNKNSMYVSGWKTIESDGTPQKLEFRFTI
ncbi:hypothetical protein PL373_16055 [Tenacibaculum maritimum]|nr:hypothetical protein [Tenacibaculum maritimum]MDB0602616.1 hypothetical protein [Tenacibaculum maritimum]MDB0611273.1 hypothetical protein [Tenacibaculum maritimum]